MEDCCMYPSIELQIFKFLNVTERAMYARSLLVEEKLDLFKDDESNVRASTK